MPVGVNIITPASAIWTAAQIRSRFRVDSTFDDLIAEYLSEATGKVERDTNRCLMATILEQIEDGFPAGSLPLQIREALAQQLGQPTSTAMMLRSFMLMRCPVPSITSIQYLDQSGATQTVAGSVYRLVKTEPAFVALKPGQSWPTDIADGPGCVTITFTAGAADAASVPGPLKTAVSMLVAHYLEHPEAVQVGTIANETPLGYEELIHGYCYPGGF